MMEPVLHIQLLGNLNVHYEGQPPITSLNSSRLQALLAYLLINRRNPQPRAHLAFLFWPDSSEEQALTNLRNLYHLLRRVLPSVDSYIQADRQTFHWRPSRPYTLDIEDFENALAAADAARTQHNPRVCCSGLERALELYQGDLLVSCYSDWILPERERLRQLFLDASYRLAGILEFQGESAQAIQVANNLLRFDPLQETAYRRLMELYAQNDDQAGLVRTYQTCAAMLEREMSVQPSPVTRSLYRRLLDRAAIASPPADSPSPISLPLLGRQAQLSQLQAAWTEAAVQGPQFVLVRGEAGMGKSRLLAEFSDRVRQAGGKAAAARCYTAEGSLAFAPLAAWLRARPLPPLEAPWLAEIARLLPEVHAQKAGPPPALAPLEDWQRPRLFEATARALLYSSQPLLLTLDDLQWCDRDTLDWLRFLLQYDGKTEVLVAASLRPEELHGRRPLQSFLSSLRQSANFHLVDLAPLDPEQTARLAGQAAGGIVAPETGSRLYQASLGNPYFVIEMAACGWAQIKAANGSSPEIPPLPPAVEALLCARLERISPAAGSVLELAAAAGLRCPYPLLVEQSGLGERRLVNVLDELTGRLILAEEQTDTSYETGNAGPTLAYHFTHPLLRQVAWSRLSAARRRLLANAVQGARNKARVTS